MSSAYVTRRQPIHSPIRLAIAIAASRTQTWRHEDGDIGIGVLPQSEEILISGAGLGAVALQQKSAAEAQGARARERRIPDDAAMLKDSLDSAASCRALMPPSTLPHAHRPVSLDRTRSRSEFVRSRSAKAFNPLYRLHRQSVRHRRARKAYSNQLTIQVESDPKDCSKEGHYNPQVSIIFSISDARRANCRVRVSVSQ